MTTLLGGARVAGSSFVSGLPVDKSPDSHQK